MRRLKTWFKWLVKAVFRLMLVGVAAGFLLISWVGYQTFFGDYTELQKSTILAKIREETVLYYLDE